LAIHAYYGKNSNHQLLGDFHTETARTTEDSRPVTR
jgi:hypothetical protein